MDKKGSGQVEMILSFVIFLGFVIFLFAVFPVYREEKSTAGISSAERGILREAGMRIDYFTVSLDEPVESCFCFADNYQGVRIAKNIGGGKFAAKSDSGFVCINGNDTFYQVYISDEFEAGEFDAGECRIIDEGMYRIGLRRKIDSVFNSSLNELKNLYESDYELLKERFGISNSENFGFKIVDLNGQELLTAVREIPKRVEVQAKSLPVEIFYSNGDSAFGMLNILTW